ncbi:hypothetical protein Tco_0440011 [Tanacetum coccineum]
MSSSRVDISEEHASSFYLGGLPTEIEMGMRMFKPKTLANAYQLTNLQEATLEAIKKKNKTIMGSQNGRFSAGSNSYGSNVKSSLLHLPTPNSNWKNKLNTPTNAPVRRQLTQKEYQEKRDQNLCFYCDQKYTPGQKCSGQLFSIVLLADDEMECEKECMMEFMYKNKRMTLRGTPKAAIHWLDGKNQDKEFEGTTNVELLMFCVYLNIRVQLINVEGQSIDDMLDRELNKVVDTFEDVFTIPTELPPQRNHDHTISLIPNTQLINIRPYRHPPM